MWCPRFVRSGVRSTPRHLLPPHANSHQQPFRQAWEKGSRTGPWHPRNPRPPSPVVMPPLPASAARSNILADRYATSGMHNYCPPRDLAWGRRKQRILEELAEVGADILCLQEVRWHVQVQCVV